LPKERYGDSLRDRDCDCDRDRDRDRDRDCEPNTRTQDISATRFRRREVSATVVADVLQGKKVCF